MANKPSFNVEKFISDQYLHVIGKNIPALFKAVNSSLYDTQELMQAIVDQLFVTTASGRYLIKLGEGGGFVMPENSGLDMSSYKVLVPIMISDPKQVRITVESLVEAFYGKERTRPNITSPIAGPYNLQDRDSIIVETPSGRSEIAILANQVSDITNVSAQELASVLNNGQDIFDAEVVFNNTTKTSTIRIYSKIRGHGSYVKIIGGTLQNVLQFPYFIGTDSNTTWLLEKESDYTDVIKFTWDGLGTNPEIFKTQKGDFVTIRGLTDGAEEFSKLNGSYEVMDSGYDYFIVRNESFKELTSTLLSDHNISFSENKASTLFDLPEKATVSEVEGQTVTISVPAVPPLVRRYLKGSMHLQGWRHRVLDFTRTTLKIEITPDQQKPIGKNSFVHESDFHKYDFSQFYRTVMSDSSTSEPVYTVSTDGRTFPYTVAQPISNAISMNPGSDIATVKFAFPHGLQYGWGVTLSGFSGSSNIDASEINKEHIVYHVVNDNEIQIRLSKYDGEGFGPFDVYRQSDAQADGSDFYLQFANTGDLSASGLQVGDSITLEIGTGTDVNAYYGSRLRYKNFTVVSLNGSTARVVTGLGTGPEGVVITGVNGFKSSNFGSGSYYFDKTSETNKGVLDTLFATFIEETPSENLVGSFVYDPDGLQTDVTVSDMVVETREVLLRGETKRFIMVEDGDFPESGDLVIGYGTDKYEGPIRFYAYNRSGSETEIMIDPAYKFKNTHEVGTNIFHIHKRSPFEPTMFGDEYASFLTGTVNGRETMFKLVELLVAFGIFVEKNVELPELRYQDPSISPFE